MRTLTSVFKALSDETRLTMLGLLLEEGELCVCDFVDVLEISQSKASRHLRHLVGAGLLDDRREGTWVHFRIAERPEPAQAQVIEMLPAVLDNRIPPELFVRLADWRKSNERGERSCGDLLAERAARREGKR
ncbi:MAG: metalloregulator ArsR/SmtB family transcription factor [Polyangia bacterium]